ncbi:iron ABC transporter permease [Testudinibacter sp. TR-2022]|uniref:FecCD family ABC transporter permease n=1 Tax=Testudinibacter sp. TR-2022 TaxID=2585029 RepID=UPI0011198A89|nr:iron ABC transporter permease [Testudinibacter sp. TR-2022]TNH05537.1 iron ABC transporter permease [Pasteurellaceae bacterium Phil31]TNH11569.1 iron ABC transporter permease [Testudinibacter sp. TR-2022]TNH11936.1 iron ABC transporter permease [Testudinibacter sp. TR-2022]TNH12638.1 iron ABC transporter permease [Testudinibacter sp. TR-2022]TNH18046.1 iron ABC transporter permease [Testudinibacter sp. TR-2022]
MMKHHAYFLVLAIGLLLLSAIILLSLVSGAVNTDLWQTLTALYGKGDSSTVFIVQQLRLPRTLLGVFIGAILGCCGAVLQGLFRNPLADPGIIGVSAGAALGAAIAIVLLPQGILLWNKLSLLSLFSFIGGLLATLFVYHIGKTHYGTRMTLILLSGIAIGALAFAFLGLLQFIADDRALRELTTWQLGSLAHGNCNTVILCAVTAFLLLTQFMRRASALNALLLGDLEARHLGVSVEKIKRSCIIYTALGIGIAVSVSGMIGFIGLIVPHIARTLLGPNHKTLIPACALIGAILLLGADILARKLAAPAEIPIGILTALLGAPFFITLLIKNKGRL